MLHAEAKHDVARTRYGQPLSASSALPAEATGLEVEAAVAAACAALPAPELPARRYTTSDDPDEIAAASEDILVVTTLEACLLYTSRCV